MKAPKTTLKAPQSSATTYQNLPINVISESSANHACCVKLCILYASFGSPLRKVRNPQSIENDQIRIISLWCETSLQIGQPYTVRILPDFLIPHSFIRLDRLLEAAEASKGNPTSDQLCLHLGCIDPRTVRGRMALLHEAIKEVSLNLSYRRSAMGHPGQTSHPTGACS